MLHLFVFGGEFGVVHAALIVGADGAVGNFDGLGGDVERDTDGEAFDGDRFGFYAGVRLQGLLVAEGIDDFLRDGVDDELAVGAHGADGLEAADGDDAFIAVVEFVGFVTFAAEFEGDFVRFFGRFDELAFERLALLDFGHFFLVDYHVPLKVATWILNLPGQSRRLLATSLFHIHHELVDALAGEIFVRQQRIGDDHS